MLLYSEERLSLLGSSRSDEGLPWLAGELLQPQSRATRARLVSRLLRSIGFEWLAYATVAYRNGRPRPSSIFTSYAHPEWVRRYVSCNHHEVDMRLQDMPGSGLPLVWDLQRLEASPSSPARQPELDDSAARQRLFLQDLRAHRIGSGVFFRLAAPARTGELTVISLSSRLDDRRWITDSVVGQALLLGLGVHEYLSRHRHAARVSPGSTQGNEQSSEPASGMSGTQQKILHQLLEGRSDKEIAYRLQLPPSTVDYHMRRLRTRFSVRNRVQLVNAGLGSRHPSAAGAGG